MLQDDEEAERNEGGVDHEGSPLGGLKPAPRLWIVGDFVFADFEVRDADCAEQKAEENQDPANDLDIVQR